MKPIKTQIEEIEREIKEIKSTNREENNQIMRIARSKLNPIEQGKIDLAVSGLRKQTKLQTLKECKKMFEDYNEKLKDLITYGNYYGDRSFTHLFKQIDNLSKEVLEE